MSLLSGDRDGRAAAGSARAESGAPAARLTMQIAYEAADLKQHLLTWQALAERAVEPNVFYEPAPFLAGLECLEEAPPAQVIGNLLNAVFLDQFDADALRLERINGLLAGLPPDRRGPFRRLELLVLRPSTDLGVLANECEARLPGSLRFLTRGLGTRETRSNDLLSLLMFQPDYVSRLIELGERDAGEQAPRIDAFLDGPGATCALDGPPRAPSPGGA